MNTKIVMTFEMNTKIVKIDGTQNLVGYSSIPVVLLEL